MKNLFCLAVLFSSFLFSSCSDDLKNLLDVSFNTTITEDVYGIGTVPFENLPVVISLDDNAEIKKYSNKIKNIEIKKMSYKVVEFQGDPSGKIIANLSANGKPFHSISINSLKDAFDNKIVFPITDQEALIDLANSSLANKTITLNASGQSESAQPMGFRIQFTIELAIVANPL
jgi:hypothetical protein